MTNYSLLKFAPRAMPLRQLFSTAVLQDQIAQCCCVPAPPPTPAPASADLQIAATLVPTVDNVSGMASLLLTMIVTNNGPASAKGVNVNVAIPALSATAVVIRPVPVTPVVVVGSGLQASVGSMTSGQSRSLQCTFVPLVAARSVFIPVRPIIVAVSGTVSGTTLDPNSSNNTFSTSAIMPFPAQVKSFSGSGTAPVNQAVAIFSKKLQGPSVNANTFQIADAITGASVAGSVTYDDPSQSAKFSVSGAGFPIGNYYITLIGTGASPIVDVDGFALDGNFDSRPGGDYSNKLSVTAAPG